MEDDAPLRAMVAEVLADEGHAVATAASAEQAWCLIQRLPPDVVLLDQRLPGMPGMALSRIIQADPQTRHVPVVLMTALPPPRADAPGAPAAYLPKPFTIATMLATLQEAAPGA
ncbi:MAG TPA: response regulator [Herpetosiphonaceae bacterium]